MQYASILLGDINESVMAVTLLTVGSGKIKLHCVAMMIPERFYIDKDS
jgi:hypothetical protein